MDTSLVAWARAVKARRRGQGPPPLWLFTDPARIDDLAGAVATLPRGLCGVVVRHAGGAAALSVCNLSATVFRKCHAGRSEPIAGSKMAGQYSVQVWLTRPARGALQLTAAAQGMGRGLGCPPSFSAL